MQHTGHHTAVILEETRGMCQSRYIKVCLTGPFSSHVVIVGCEKTTVTWSFDMQPNCEAQNQRGWYIHNLNSPSILSHQLYQYRRVAAFGSSQSRQYDFTVVFENQKSRIHSIKRCRSMNEDTLTDLATLCLTLKTATRTVDTTRYL